MFWGTDRPSRRLPSKRSLLPGGNLAGVFCDDLEILSIAEATKNQTYEKTNKIKAKIKTRSDGRNGGHTHTHTHTKGGGGYRIAEVRLLRILPYLKSAVLGTLYPGVSIAINLGSKQLLKCQHTCDSYIYIYTYVCVCVCVCVLSHFGIFEQFCRILVYCLPKHVTGPRKPETRNSGGLK